MRIFEMLQSTGLIAAILACWVVRWLAKRMNQRASTPFWRLLIVAADASWIFIGLYALDKWKDEFIRWLGAGSMLETANAGSLSLMAAYAAQQFVPAEFRPTGVSEQLQNLFFYALLPMIWLVMAAIINGYDLSAPRAAVPDLPVRSRSWRKWMRDFAMHFLGGYQSRYQPVWTCLKLTLGAGLGTLLTFIVAWRAIGWLGAWLWYGATRTLGPYDLDTWQIIAGAMGVFIGSPSELDGGILMDAMRIVLLAAVLEYAVSTQSAVRPHTVAT